MGRDLVGRRAGTAELVFAIVGVLAAVGGLSALPATAVVGVAPTLRSIPGTLAPVVLGPSPALPTVVGSTSAAGPHLHAASASSSFVVNYDAGFDANPAAKTAFQAAVDEWAGLLTSSVPIEVDASFADLGSPSILGSAGPTSLYANFAGAPQTNTWYPVALANARAGVDLNGGTAEISAHFSSTYPNFYFGTDGNTAGKLDFESVVLHELGHGLGFVGSMEVGGGVGSCGCAGTPFAYDRPVTSNGTPILSFTDGSAALANALQGTDVRFTGSNAMTANGGVAPKLYAPASWQSGSSYSHLDEATYPAGNPNSLMTPAIGNNEVIHAPGPITLGIFSDLGWVATTLPKLSISSARVVEGNSGTRRLRANVALSFPVAWTVTAHFATSNATATAGSDYTASSGTVTIPAGATIATPSFVTRTDRSVEPAEKFTVKLSAPSGATLGPASTSLYILNDDPSSGLSISAGSATVVEGDTGDRLVSLTLSMSLVKSTKSVSVDWATGTGTATPGVDYETNGGTVTFAPGATYARVQVLVHPDTIHEGTETIPIVLSNSVGAPIAKSTGTIAISDDD